MNFARDLVVATVSSFLCSVFVSPALAVEPVLTCTYKQYGYSTATMKLNPARIVEDGHDVGFFERQLVAAVSAWNATGWNFRLTYGGLTSSTTPAGNEVIVYYGDDSAPNCRHGVAYAPWCQGTFIKIVRDSTNSACQGVEHVWGTQYPEKAIYGGDGDYFRGYKDLFGTLVHEIGHILGFQHSSDPTPYATVMFPAYSVETLEAFRYPSAADQYQLLHGYPVNYGVRQNARIKETFGYLTGGWPSTYMSQFFSNSAPGAAKALEAESLLPFKLARTRKDATVEDMRVDLGSGCFLCGPVSQL